MQLSPLPQPENQLVPVGAAGGTLPPVRGGGMELELRSQRPAAAEEWVRQLLLPWNATAEEGAVATAGIAVPPTQKVMTHVACLSAGGGLQWTRRPRP